MCLISWTLQSGSEQFYILSLLSFITKLFTHICSAFNNVPFVSDSVADVVMLSM
jgi:hypothetical protein